MTITKPDFLLDFIGKKETKRKYTKVVRVLKDECPFCGDVDPIKNGFDYQFKGTRREKKIPKYICRSCGKRFRERNYITAGRLMTRQAAILWLQGFEYKDIAKRLGITEISAKRHVLSLLKYERAILVRKTDEEESPRAKSHTVLQIPLIKMWKEPKKKDEE